MASVLQLLWTPVNVLCGLYLMCFFFASGLLINIGQLMVVLVSPKKYSLATCQHLANVWWDLYPFFFELYYRIPVRISGDLIPQDECAILIGNHGAGVDFISGTATRVRRVRMVIRVIGW